MCDGAGIAPHLSPVPLGDMYPLDEAGGRLLYTHGQVRPKYFTIDTSGFGPWPLMAWWDKALAGGDR